MEFMLNTVRMIDRDQAKEFALGDEQSLKEKLAVAFINPKDFEELGMVKSLKLHLSNENGDVIVNNIQDEEVPPGTIVMPVSIWANQLTGVDGKDLVYKGIKVEVEPSRDEPLELKELLQKIKEGD